MHDPQEDRKRVPVEPLTYGEQHEALVLLRYWAEYHKGGLEPDLSIVHFTDLLLAAHPART